MEVTSFLERSYSTKKDLGEQLPLLRIDLTPLHSAFISQSCIRYSSSNHNLILHWEPPSSSTPSILRSAQRLQPFTLEELDTLIPTPVARRISIEATADTYDRENGTLFSIGCYAATDPSIWALGLSRRSRIFLLPVWRTIWRPIELWAVKLQFQGP